MATRRPRRNEERAVSLQEPALPRALREINRHHQPGSLEPRRHVRRLADHGVRNLDPLSLGQAVVCTSMDRMFAEPVLQAAEKRLGIRAVGVCDTGETKSPSAWSHVVLLICPFGCHGQLACPCDTGGQAASGTLEQQPTQTAVKVH